MGLSAVGVALLTHLLAALAGGRLLLAFQVRPYRGYRGWWGCGWVGGTYGGHMGASGGAAGGSCGFYRGYVGHVWEL